MMMNNKLTILMLLCMGAFLTGCYKDDSTVDTHILSAIEIELPEIQTAEVNIDKNDTLTIRPVISQSSGELPLSYEWQVNYEVVSEEKDFTYVGTDLGTFPVRLKVSNDDGSTFKEFTLNVNSPYEEGLIVLGEDAAGMATLSFLRKFPGRPIYQASANDFATGIFALNNPGMTLGSGPTDITKRVTQLYIAAKNDGKITIINDKTLEVESVITAPEFPDFKPIALNIPDDLARSSLILTENGKLYTIATLDHLILANTSLDADVRLAPRTQFLAGLNFTMNYFWEPATSVLWNIWYMNTNSKDLFAGQDMIQFFSANGLCYVVTRDRNNPTNITKTILGEYIQEYFADPLDIREQRMFTEPNMTLKDNSVTVLNERYFRLIYADGRQIYRWNYSGVDFPSSPYIELDIPGVITSMETNPEGTELYVGVYNAAGTDAPGSIVVYDIDRGTKLAEFEGVTDKPVKLYFKERT